jgi:hypothetical protein
MLKSGKFKTAFERTIKSEFAALKAQKRGKPGKNAASAQ